MALPTVKVTIGPICDETGAPVVGKKIMAQLTVVERYQGYVVPSLVQAETDSAGMAVLDLWPNELGTNGSQYKFTIPAGTKGMSNIVCAIPNADCALHAISNLPPYPPKEVGTVITTEIQTMRNDAQAASASAQASATAAAGSAQTATDKATAADVSAQAAAQSATGAAASKDAAATSEVNAKASETAAAGSKDAAAQSETHAATSKDAAAASATAAAASAEAAATSATAASNSAGQAVTSATDAAASKTAAATSETNAKTSETNAKASETAAAQSSSDAANAKTAAELARDQAQVIAGSVRGVGLVSTIADRNALTPTQGQQIWVSDATGDPTVTLGAALYLWGGSSWIKVAEVESMDKVLHWADILDKPDTYPPSPHNQGWATIDDKPAQYPDADQLDGHHADTGTTAGTVPVRDANGKIPGGITGDADTVDGKHAADFLPATHPASAITGYGSATQAVGTPAPGTSLKVAREDHVHGSEFPSGTAMLFCQSTAPTGWTKSTTHNDKALRIVNDGTGGQAGGSVAFSTVFTRTTSDAGGGGGTYGTTLDGNTLPSHNHHLSSWSLAMNQNGGNDFFFPASSHDYDNWDNSSDHITYAGGSAAHSHGTPTHTHGMDMRVQYVNSIIATKD